MSYKPEQISETDLVVPTLQALAKSPERWLPINELIDHLVVAMRPAVEDNLVAARERDHRILQIVRNMVTQKTAERNIFRQGYAVYMDNCLKITENGLAFLRKKTG